VLSGRGLCDEMITRPEETYRLCCVVVCDLETSRMGAPYTYDISRHWVKKNYKGSFVAYLNANLHIPGGQIGVRGCVTLVICVQGTYSLPVPTQIPVQCGHIPCQMFPWHHTLSQVR